MFDRFQHWFASFARDAQLQKRFELLRHRTAVPVFWLLGKTQSGKTSIVKHLTGAEQAEIGQGFKPCTRYSREYQFPTSEAPLLTFLDTRGMDEPGYDPGEDLSKFDQLAHVLIVTVKALDHAQENVLRHLGRIRRSQPHRPVILALTCLHEAYPQQQHPQPYPFNNGDRSTAGVPAVPDSLRRSLDEQRARFAGLFDRFVPLDLTPAEEGFAEPAYGGEQLKQVILDVLPGAFRQTVLTLDEAKRDLQDLYARQALPHIVGYSVLAASAGALPIPWLDLLIIPAVQSRMIFHLGQFYGQPVSAARFLELASSLGLGMLVRQAVRETTKLIPYVGSVASGVLAGASTFALGKAFCYYYSAVHQGHVPRVEDLKHYYQEQLALAEKYLAVARPAYSRGTRD